MKRYGILITILILIVGLATCAPVLAATSSTPEIPFDGEVPISPNVRQVLILAGSDYEMGYQWYQQLVQVFGPWILEDMQVRWSADFTEEELNALKAYQSYIEQYAPEMIDMFKGMADGATDAGFKLSYTQVLAQWTETRTYPGAPAGSELKELPPEVSDGCSGVAAWGSATTDGRVVAASSQNTTKEWDVTIICLPEEGNSFICSPYNPLGAHDKPSYRPKLGGSSMNNKGLVQVREPDIASIPEAEWTYGLTEGIASLHTLRYADDAMEALDMLLAYPSGDGLLGGFWVDTQGNAFQVESRENPRVIRKAGDYGEQDFLYFTNNALSYEAGDFREDASQGTTYIRHGGWFSRTSMSSVSRNLQIWNMFNYYKGDVNPEFVKMMWRFDGDPNPAASVIVEMELGEASAETYELLSTLRLQKNIGGLHNGVVMVMVPDKLEYYVCEGTPRRLTLKPPYFYDPLYSFIQLKLESSPQKITSAAKNQAGYELTRGEKELMKLSHSDAAYALLKEKLDQATMAWYNGIYYTKLANQTTGNESVYNWAKALRGFVKCQTYAQNIYESLVTPPKSPEDLGLKPWGYWLKTTR